MIGREPLVRIMCNVSDTWVEAVKARKALFETPSIFCAKHIPQQQRLYVVCSSLKDGRQKYQKTFLFKP